MIKELLLVLVIGQYVLADSISDFETEMLEGHNVIRKEIGLSYLKWDDKLKKASLRLAKKCEFKHSDTKGKYGENIALHSAMKDGTDAAAFAVSGWNDEEKYYDKKTGECKGGVCQHYTQVVWKNTTKVGCAYKKCTKQAEGTLVFCQYTPAGNCYGEKAY
ncbi:uncharacterized protein LOC141910492 [Tubulanus polymorphus]|uniref:uncharacterized protein LOC141910492 n=1 Tax=Tubulanus polymorphus TaxID=672921 RepID=UPI003DA333C7